MQAYKLELRSDWEAVVGFVDASAAEQGAALNSRNAAVTHAISLFTGSALAVTRIEVANDPNKPVTSVRVRFSEPVRVASLAGNLTLTGGDGRALAGCPWSAHRRACASGASTELSELVDIVFPSAVPSTVITASTLRVANSVQGAGRTIGEAAQIHLRTAAAGSPFVVCSDRIQAAFGRQGIAGIQPTSAAPPLRGHRPHDKIRNKTCASRPCLAPIMI